jgi:aminobenzoyl-glutamate utilization protein B
VASVWYYFRHTTYAGIKEIWAAGDQIARGAAMMTGTELQPTRVLGSAWPQHFNRPVAEAVTANIQRVGLPVWSEDDQRFARAVQKEIGVREEGLATRVAGLTGPVSPASNNGGGSDDIGDISWNVPTITLRYPSNIPGLPGHNWADAIAMATPIAHKGATAGAKVQALTLVDLLLEPELVQAAWEYFRTVQTREVKYEPLIRPEDRPAVDLNREVMAKYREAMEKLYFDPAKHKTYLDQLGITYPTIRR